MGEPRTEGRDHQTRSTSRLQTRWREGCGADLEMEWITHCNTPSWGHDCFGLSRKAQSYRYAHSCGKNDPGIVSASPKTTNNIDSTLMDPSTSVTPSRGGFSDPFWNMMA